MNAILNHKEHLYLFLVFSTLVLSSIFISIYAEVLYVVLIPFAFLFAGLLVKDLSKVYLLMFAVLPFTVEYNLPNGLGIDIPTELLMILFTGIGIVSFIMKAKDISSRYILNPISLLLILHVVWIFFTALFSVDLIRSIKFILAKLWFIIPFYCLPFWFLKEKEQLLKLCKILLISITIACVYVWINHAGSGFSFQEINRAAHPVFRNHVNYAGMILVIMPFYWVYIKSKRVNEIFTFLLYALGIFLIVSIFLSYTRAAMISLVVGIASSAVIHFKLMKPVLFIGIAATTIFVWHLITENEFISYAPEYEKTITHERFDNLIEATAKGEDISTMERAYRWVAGGYMVQDRPITGFGPGTFYIAYEPYALSMFKTYVSHNPDQSTIHNYFFLVLVEQGIFGFLILVCLCIYALVRGEALVHYYTGFKRRMILAATTLFIMILLLNLINDMVESLKVGSFFFLALFIIAKYDIEMRQEEKQKRTVDYDK